jgi:hypothetical protein
MCRGLMMIVVTGMFDRLRLSQSANGQDTAHQEDRNEFCGAVVHGNQSKIACLNDNGLPQALSSQLL